jgi:hypothetical protein
MVSGETLPISNDVLVELTLGQCSLTTWVFVISVIDKFILGLDVFCAYNLSVDLGCCVLWLGNEEVPL